MKEEEEEANEKDKKEKGDKSGVGYGGPLMTAMRVPAGHIPGANHLEVAPANAGCQGASLLC